MAKLLVALCVLLFVSACLATAFDIKVDVRVDLVDEVQVESVKPRLTSPPRKSPKTALVYPSLVTL